MHAVRAKRHAGHDQRAAMIELAGVIGIAARPCEALDFLRGGVDPYLAEMRAGRADYVGSHDVIHHGVAAFGDSPA
ncbi:hypothetical protein CSC75_19220 [Pseudoxanthomonas wuyuanensis]|nr:hypothetical protein CSC75_19220 [Pseudoxanthomonas wuyuanensis]